jgi:hypothetical protein
MGRFNGVQPLRELCDALAHALLSFTSLQNSSGCFPSDLQLALELTDYLHMQGNKTGCRIENTEQGAMESNNLPTAALLGKLTSKACSPTRSFFHLQNPHVPKNQKRWICSQDDASYADHPNAKAGIKEDVAVCESMPIMALGPKTWFVQ